MIIVSKNMLAIVKTGGKQYVVRPGDKIKVEKLNASPEGEVIFDNLLLIEDDEKGIKVGMPYVLEYKVIGKVLSEKKGKKLIIYKYKPKKRYQRKRGHRQKYTMVEIMEITNRN